MSGKWKYKQQDELHALLEEAESDSDKDYHNSEVSSDSSSSNYNFDDEVDSSHHDIDRNVPSSEVSDKEEWVDIEEDSQTFDLD